MSGSGYPAYRASSTSKTPLPSSSTLNPRDGKLVALRNELSELRDYVKLRESTEMEWNSMYLIPN